MFEKLFALKKTEAAIQEMINAQAQSLRKLDRSIKTLEEALSRTQRAVADLIETVKRVNRY